MKSIRQDQAIDSEEDSDNYDGESCRESQIIWGSSPNHKKPREDLREDPLLAVFGSLKGFQC